VSLVKLARRFLDVIPLGTALAVVLFLPAGAAGAPKAPAASGALTLEKGEFDPSLFDSLLQKYVREDGVDYRAWKADGPEALDRFLDAAAGYDLGSTMGKEPRAAFLINTYNAWAIRQILDHYPVKSVKDIPGFFDKNARRIAGEDRTLDGIETDLAAILPHRPLFVFTLAPGARGMPALAGRAYVSHGFNGEVQKAAKKYLTPARLHFDQEDSTLCMPPQFRKHLDLFQALPRGLNGVLGSFMQLSQLTALLGTTNPRYAYDEVDWSLNEAAPPGPESGKAK
jgi:hypothetical protein